MARKEGDKRAALEDIMNALNKTDTPVYNDKGDSFTFFDGGDPACLWEVSIKA